MAFRETLELLLNANADGGITEVRRFASEAVKSTEQAESSFRKLGSTALKLGGTGMAAGGFLTAMADADKQSLEGLKATIATTGHSYDEYEGKVDSLIKKQAEFGHTDGEVTRALSTLTASFGDADKAADHMQLVADLAAKKDISLADAAEIVAKAHGGAGRIFKEFNVQVQTNADGTKNYDGALDQLSQKLTGQASASVTGFTGHLKVLGAEAENFISDLGQKFGPAILGVSSGLTALGGISTGVGKIQDWLAARHAAAAAAAEAQAAAEGELAGSELLAGEGASKLSLAMGAVAGAAIVGGLYAYGRSLNDIKSASDLAAQSTHMNTDQTNRFLDGVREGGTTFLPAYKDQLKAIADQGDAGIGTLRQYRDHLVSMGQSTTEVDQALQAAADSQKNLNDKTAAGADQTANLTQKLEEQDKAWQALNDSRQKDLDLIAQQAGGAIALSNAEIGTRRSIDDMNKSLKDGTQTADEHQKAINDAESAILSQADAAAKLAGQTGSATDATNAQIRELEGVMQTLAPNSPLRQFVQQYIDQLNSTPTEINTQFNVYENVQTSTIPGLNRNLKQYDSGGFVDAPRGKPQLAIVHGGEYVSTVAEVDAAKKGRMGGVHPVAGVGAHTSVVQLVVDRKVLSQIVLEGFAMDEKRNGKLPLRSTR